MLKIIATMIWGAGAFFFLFIALTVVLSGEREEYKDHEHLLKHVNALLTCVAFMLVGIGIQFFFR